MEKTAKAGRKVTGEWEYKSTRSLPSEMTHVQADPALGRNTDWQQEWLSPSWPGCSLFNFKGALGREQGDTSKPSSAGPSSCHPLVCSSSARRAQCAQCSVQHPWDDLRAGSCTRQPHVCSCTLCCKRSTSCSRIHSPTLLLHT